VGVHSAEQSARIAASPEACFETLCDYESFPDWQQAVQSVEVLERDSDGRGSSIRFEIDAKVRKVSYTLRYSYEAPSRIWWELIEGDVAAVEGEYLLEPAGDGGTQATYRLGIDPGVPVPGLLARQLTKGVMRRSVTDLRDEVERRAAAAA
jgi:ribosome-associated toxin RatA of RatAB toxin-antitoxin module